MRKCTTKKLLNQKFFKSSFQNSWLAISQSPNKLIKSNENIKNIDKDTYLTEIPFSQEFLAESYQIFRNRLQYTNFVQIPADQINKLNLYECFHGILFFIYYYSENKFNIEELEFHFSGGRQYNYLTLKKTPDQSNIINIFEYQNISNQFIIKPTINAFFGITFKRIKVTPIAYSLRSGINNFTSSHLISFNFEGFDENNKKWVVLDERVNINDLISTGAFSLFFVRNTNNSFSSFRIRQTEPGNNGFWGFSIAAFDIHGIISLNENYAQSPFECLTENTFLLNETNNNEGEYDPIMDMSEFLL